MVIVLLTISYLAGLLWYVFSEYVSKLEEAPFNLNFDNGQEYFIDAYEMRSMEHERRALVMTYFTFTSMTTVGFGDYHPVSNLERLVGAIFLLIGVSITSYIIESVN